MNPVFLFSQLTAPLGRILQGSQPGSRWWYKFAAMAVVYGIYRLIRDHRDSKKTLPVSTTPSESQVVRISDNESDPFYPLSIWASHPFYLDGILCTSLCSFLCALCFEDKALQEDICLMTSKVARSREVEGKKNWRASGKLYWEGQAYDRESPAYQALLRKAVTAQFTSLGNADLMRLLKSTAGKPMYDSSLPSNSADSPLTGGEYVRILSELR